MGSKDAYTELVQAKSYIGKIGKKQDHLSDNGYLSTLDVKTTIHYQPIPGATNYHGNRTFDCYLAEEIKSRFMELAGAVLEKMQKKVNNELLQEESYYRKQLELIEKIKEENKLNA